MLVAALSALPRPKLTATDLASRIDFPQEEIGERPRDHLRSGCKASPERHKALLSALEKSLT